MGLVSIIGIKKWHKEHADHTVKTLIGHYWWWTFGLCVHIFKVSRTCKKFGNECNLPRCVFYEDTLRHCTECNTCTLYAFTNDKILICVLTQEACEIFSSFVLYEDSGKLLKIDCSSLHDADCCKKLRTNFNILSDVYASKENDSATSRNRSRNRVATGNNMPNAKYMTLLSTLKNPRDRVLKRALIQSGAHARSRGTTAKSCDRGWMETSIESAGAARVQLDL